MGFLARCRSLFATGEPKRPPKPTKAAQPATLEREILGAMEFYLFETFGLSRETVSREREVGLYASERQLMEMVRSLGGIYNFDPAQLLQAPRFERNNRIQDYTTFGELAEEIAKLVLSRNPSVLAAS
jgi:hypothetical protein